MLQPNAATVEKQVGVVRICDSTCLAIQSRIKRPSRIDWIVQTSLCVLADFRWPWAITAFQESVEEFQPTVILIEYIKLAYLLDGLTRDQRDSIHCIVDTHDILSERCRQFRERGHAHWVEIDRREEADEISKFDLAIAIQDHEASQLREMCTGTKVITCGHFADLNQIATNPATGLTQLREPDSVLTLGCMASANAANISSLQAFVDRYWSKAVKNQTANSEARLRLVIAGNVCEHLSTSQLDPEVVASIQCIGFQEQLSPFYQTVDIVVNPIDFGTGLKIKNLEALAFGRPLLTTPHGAQGMEVFLDSKSPIRIYDSPEAFTELIKRLLDPNQLEQLCGLARTFRESGLSQKETYSQLSEFLEEHRELS